MSKTNPFDGPVLNDSVFERASMVKSKFNGVDLSDSFFFAVLKKVKFNDCKMDGVEYDDVDMSNAVFNNVKLINAKFTNINMANVDISDANLQGMKINDILVTDLLESYQSR